MSLVRITRTVKDFGLLMEEGQVPSFIDSKAPYFQSLYYYPGDALNYFQSNRGSIKGYKGKVFTPQITFDIDSKDLEVSRDNTIRLLQYLEQHGLYNDQAAKIAFSGSKGFHIHINTEHTFNPKELKDLCVYLGKQIKFNTEAGFKIDPSVYNTNRIFRIANTPNEKTGLFKVEMLSSDIINFSMDEIREAAKVPQPTYSFESAISKDSIREVLAHIPKKSVVIPTSYTAPSVSIDKPCIAALQDGDMKDGESNAGLLRLANHYRRAGMGRAECRAKLLEAADNRKLKYPGTNNITLEKINGEILSSVYSGDGYIFTCTDWMLTDKCGGTCQMKCQTDLPAKQASFKRPEPVKVEEPPAHKRGMFRDVPSPVAPEERLKMSGFKRLRDSAGSYKEFVKTAVKYRVLTGIKEIDEKVKIIPNGLTIINARPGVGKCLGKGTPIRMFDGSVKSVEDVVIGDLLMGPDSTPRQVLSLARGREEMFKVTQNHGMDYEVNASHILSFKHPEKGLVNIEVRDFLSKSARFQTRCKGWKASIEYQNRSTLIDPYILGAWLGDGHSSGPSFTSMDPEIIGAFVNYAENNGLLTRYVGPAGKANTYRLTRYEKRQGIKNQFTEGLRYYDLIENKHIPEEYLVNSRSVRLQLLAGLLDTDGYYSTKQNIFEITTKFESLAKGIQTLCWSLGLAVTHVVKDKTCGNNGKVGAYHCLTISGTLGDIPTRLPRKQGTTALNRNHLHTGVSLTSLGEGDYYGFEIDGDKLFLLEDGTVTHNTSMALNILENVSKSGQTGAFYSIDMDEDEYYTKSASKALKISPDEAMDLFFNENPELDDLRAEAHEKTDKVVENILFNFDKSLTVAKIESDLQAAIAAGNKPFVIVVDYIQKINGASDYHNATNILLELKRLISQYKVCIIALSQIPGGIGGDEESPVYSARAARGGSIYEENASICINMWRPMKFAGAEQDNIMGYSVSKNRMGECFSGYLHFEGAISLVRDMTDEEKIEAEVSMAAYAELKASKEKKRGQFR